MLIAAVLLALPALANAQVTIDPVVTSIGAARDPVPGRDAPFVFRGEANVQLPVMNANHDIAFRARSAADFDNNTGVAWGIYARPSAGSLTVLADTTVDNVGTPLFPVPGRPAGARFLDFKAPLLNNAGDVVFQASFNDPIGGTSSGIYAAHVSGGPLVKIVDTYDLVPGGGGATFATFVFASAVIQDLTAAALNNAGQVAFWARYNASDTGLFGSTVAGGAIVQLADKTITPLGVPFGTPQPFVEVRPTFALSDSGMVALHGSIRLNSPAGLIRNGVFRVPVTGGPPTTMAFQFQTAPAAGAATFSNFSSEDIDETGRVIFDATLSDNTAGLYAIDAPGGTFTRIVDNRAGGLTVPGDIPGAEFDLVSLAPLNEDGALGFFARIRNSAVANNQGIYLANVDANTIDYVQDAAATAPGLSAPARLTNFEDMGAAINASGNLAFAARGTDELGQGMRGLYFYDSCTSAVQRIVDSTISAAELGGVFSTLGTQTRKLSVYQGIYAASGRFHAVSDDNQVAFLAQFDNFDFGIYVATVTSAGGAGQIEITCPADVALECPANTSPAVLGEAVAVDACSGASIATTFEDTITNGCGPAGLVTRVWTADDGAGNVVTCSQIIDVDDTVPPSLAGVPADAAAECDAVPPAAAVTATDACDPAPVVAFSEEILPGDCPDAYALERTWTATDACGNAASAMQTITVDDTVAPAVTCPPDQTNLACQADTSPATTGMASAVDNCGAVAIASADVTASGCGDTVAITRTWTATDDCGNEASCVQAVATVDDVAPSVTCPPDQLALECGADTSPSATGTATATDDCGPASVAHLDASVAGCGGTEVVTRTWTGTDACGNAASCDQTVATVDNSPPVLSVDTTPLVVTDTDCSGSQAATLPTASAVDACGDATVTNDAPATFPAGETTTVTFTAEDDCGNSSSAALDVTVEYGSWILVDAEQFIVGFGHHPGVSHEPLEGIEACAYERGPNSCAQQVCGGTLFHKYSCIVQNCPPADCGITDANGQTTLNVPPGKYIVISEDVTQIILHEPVGTVVGDLACGETELARLRQIVRADGRRLACRVSRFTGSELLIVEPEVILWDDTEQLYPFVFESEGDWDVTVSVAPPEGFVADYDTLTEEVADEVEAVQFTVVEVGSDLVPTRTTFNITHNGRRQVFRSNVGITLTAEYARSRGFDVSVLEAKGLIREKPVLLENLVVPGALDSPRR